MFFRVKKTGGHEYLQVVENKRVGRAVRQQVVSSLGRLDHLIDSGKLMSLVVSGAKLVGQELASNSHDLCPVDSCSALSTRSSAPGNRPQPPLR